MTRSHPPLLPGRSPRALEGQHDAGRVHDAWQSAHSGRGPSRRCNKRRINGPSELACPRKLALKCAVRVSNPGPADQETAPKRLPIFTAVQRMPELKY